MAQIYTAAEVDSLLEKQRTELLSLLVSAQKSIETLKDQLNGEVLTIAQIADRLHIKSVETVGKYMKLPVTDPKYLPSIALNGKSKGARLSEVEKWIERNTPEAKAQRNREFWLNKSRRALHA